MYRAYIVILLLQVAYGLGFDRLVRSLNQVVYTGCSTGPLTPLSGSTSTLLNLTTTLIMSSTTRNNRFSVGGKINIYAGDHRFQFNKTEVESEPESIFVEYIRDNNVPTLDADPYLFSLIHAHLKGYEIFPLPSQGVPYGGEIHSGSQLLPVLPYLSKEATLKNLLRDATDFGLKNLVAKIEQEMANQLESSQGKERQKALDDDPEAMKGFVMLDSV